MQSSWKTPGACARALPMPPSSTQPSKRCSLATAPPKWTQATPPMTNTHSTSPTSGVTWRRSDKPPQPRERTAGARRALVVRAGRDWPAPCCRPVTGRGDPTAGASTHRALHDDNQGASQRSRPRARRRPGPSALSGQPGLRPERLGLPACHATGSTGRLAYARNLRCSRGRGGLLPTLTRAQGPLRDGSGRLRAPSGGFAQHHVAGRSDHSAARGTAMTAGGCPTSRRLAGLASPAEAAAAGL